MVGIFEITLDAFFIIAVSAFITGILHGATGMGGGIALVAILSHWIGIKETIPLITCVLIFSHASRIFLYLQNIDWHSARIVLIFGMPMVAVGTLIFTYLHPAVVSALMALILIVSFPVKAYAKHNQLKTSNRMLSVAGSIWGLIAGNVIGPGFFLAPFLLGTGMNRMTYVGTLACIVFCMNIVKLMVFGVVDVMTWSVLLLGIAIGLVTIPANWLGRAFLRRMNDDHHLKIIEIMTMIIILNFLWLTLTLLN